MRTRQVLILLLFIVAVCVISLIPFSKIEGFAKFPNQSKFKPPVTTDTFATTDASSTTAASTTAAGSTTAAATTMRNLTAASTTAAATTKGNITAASTTAAATTMGNLTAAATTVASIKTPTFSFPDSIKSNSDLVNAVIYINANSKDRNSDLLFIQKIQSYISNIKSQNAATLMGELTNPNNLIDTKLFLNYINWFSSHCPLDSDICTELC